MPDPAELLPRFHAACRRLAETAAVPELLEDPGPLEAVARCRSLLIALHRDERRASGTGGPPQEPLTAREAEVLRLLADGQSYDEIAAGLFIDLETVRTHARRVRRKLGVATSRELRAPDARAERREH